MITVLMMNHRRNELLNPLSGFNYQAHKTTHDGSGWCWYIFPNMKGYIDGIHGTPDIAAPWIRHGYCCPLKCDQFREPKEIVDYLVDSKVKSY